MGSLFYLEFSVCAATKHRSSGNLCIKYHLLEFLPSQIVFVNIKFCVSSLMIKVFGMGLCVLGRFPLLLLFFYIYIIYIMTGHGGFEMFCTVCEALSRPSSRVST